MSRQYSERELLLLSNFVYIPACLSTKPICEILDTYRDESGGFTEESVAAAAAGGGMSVSDVKTVFTEMDKTVTDDPEFGMLSASRCLDEKDVRAICYTGPKDEDPVVAFRGTGGTREAWCDNFEGAVYEDTHIQKIADDFIGNECAIYKDIVVTGHSKGGNLAQYVTVKHEAMIRDCVSYDGQGFGDDFTGKNTAEIEAASPKIRSISAYNDFVNILLTCIAGTCVYVANESSAAAAHSPTTLLTANTFDEEGNFVSVRPQGFIAAQLDKITDKMVDGMGDLPVKDREVMSIIAGSAISLALTTPQEDIAEGCLIPTAALVAANVTGKVAQDVKLLEGLEKPVSASVYIDTDACRSAASLVSDGESVVYDALRRVESVRQEMSYTITTRLVAERALYAVNERLAALKLLMNNLSEYIGTASAMYAAAENEAAMLMNF